tara:strand:+ start:160 stop:408 length:249 start_codon:yes stop_codon:yes gene_type:complete
MSTINSDLVTIDINGNTLDVLVCGYVIAGHDGGRDEPSTDDEFDIQSIHTMGNKPLSDLLNLPFVVESIIEQIKTEKAKCTL